MDGRGIPVQHFPFHPRTALLDGNGRHTLQQRLADAPSPEFRMNEEVLEIKPRAAEPGGIVEEVKCKTRGRAVLFRNQAGIVGVIAETVAEQVLLGRYHRAGVAFVSRKGVNEGQDGAHVCASRGADRGCHNMIVECDLRHNRRCAWNVTIVLESRTVVMGSIIEIRKHATCGRTPSSHPMGYCAMA